MSGVVKMALENTFKIMESNNYKIKKIYVLVCAIYDPEKNLFTEKYNGDKTFFETIDDPTHRKKLEDVYISKRFVNIKGAVNEKI